MAYTPELTKVSSGILRRLAWGMGAPMTKATEELLNYLPQIVDKKIVCKKCRDKSFCQKCIFFGKKGKFNGKLNTVLRQ